MLENSDREEGNQNWPETHPKHTRDPRDLFQPHKPIPKHDTNLLEASNHTKQYKKQPQFKPNETNKLSTSTIKTHLRALRIKFSTISNVNKANTQTPSEEQYNHSYLVKLIEDFENGKF